MAGAAAAESTACLAESGALEDPRTALPYPPGPCPRSPYLLAPSTAPNPALVRTLEAFDESIWRTALQLMGFDTQDPSLGSPRDTRLRLPLAGQAAASALPITLGGLGLPSMATLAPLSYVGSICTTLSAFQHFGDAIPGSRPATFAP